MNQLYSDISYCPVVGSIGVEICPGLQERAHGGVRERGSVRKRETGRYREWRGKRLSLPTLQLK